MTKESISISPDPETLETFDAIREAMEEADPYGRTISRTQILEELMEGWNEEHAEYLEGGSGNRIRIPVAN